MNLYLLISLVIILSVVIFLFLIWKSRKSKRIISSSTTAQTTMIPVLANPTVAAGYKFLEYVEKYTLVDINNLEAIAIKEEQMDSTRQTGHPLLGTGRCTTALASLCFATIEQIGLILRNSINASSVLGIIKSGNSTNANEFFSFFSFHGLQAIQPAEIEAVYYLFRNKITHNLFPKHQLGITQNISNPLNQIVISINGAYSLNVNFLSDYIKNAIPVLKNLLSNSANSSLILRVNNNIQLINSEELQDLKRKFHKNTHLQPYFSHWMPGVTF